MPVCLLNLLGVLPSLSQSGLVPLYVNPGSAQGEEGGNPNLSEKKNNAEFYFLLHFGRGQPAVPGSCVQTCQTLRAHRSPLCTISFICAYTLFPSPRSVFNCNSQSRTGAATCSLCQRTAVMRDHNETTAIHIFPACSSR